MSDLKRDFELVRKEFRNKRNLFEKHLGKLQLKKKKRAYKRVKRLFDGVCQAEKNISDVFDDPDWNDSKVFLKIKIKTFQLLLHELNSVVYSSSKMFVKSILVVLIVAFLFRTFFFGMFGIFTGAAETNLLVGDQVCINKIAYFLSKPKVGDLVMLENPVFKFNENEYIKLWQRYFRVGIPALGLPGGPGIFVKRIIAAPGDIIEGRIENDLPVIYKNGSRIVESYVNSYPLIALKRDVGFIRDRNWRGFNIPDFLLFKRKISWYSYNPMVDFSKQKFYKMEYKDLIHNQKTGKPKLLNQGVAIKDKMDAYIDIFGPMVIPEGKYWVMSDNRRVGLDSRSFGLVDLSCIRGRVDWVLWSLDSEEKTWIFTLIKNPFGFLSSIRFSRFFKRLS